MFTVTKDAEIRLADIVSGFADEASNWRAVRFNFDLLLEQYRSDYQIQISMNLINELLIAHQGGVFLCVDRVIILICRNVSKGQLDKAIFQLRYLFMDDPLAYDANGEENPQFCRIYDLGVEYAEFYQYCRKKVSQSARMVESKAIEEKAAAPAMPGEMQAARVQPFTPMRLAHIEHDLNKADLSRIIRRQPVCAVTATYDVRKVFDEYYIHIAHLRRMLRTNTDFFSNPWLFRYLTQLLDERMLDLLGTNPSRYFDASSSVNLNVKTVLSRRFREVDSIIKAAVKTSLVIEINIGDIFNDITAFIAAKNLLQQLNYRVCIDGLNDQSICQIDRDSLGFDLAKVQWNADQVTDVASERNIILQRAIKKCGANRVILSRCDSRQAVNYGQAMGINLFQGRFLDRVLNPYQKIEN